MKAPSGIKTKQIMLSVREERTVLYVRQAMKSEIEEVAMVVVVFEDDQLSQMLVADSKEGLITRHPQVT